MKKKILYGVAVFGLAAMAAWNVNFCSKTKGMSDTMLTNIEALASEHPLGDCKYRPYYICCLLLIPDGEICTPLHWAWF